MQAHEMCVFTRIETKRPLRAGIPYHARLQNGFNAHQGKKMV
jgi:hypothetical protein